MLLQPAIIIFMPLKYLFIELKKYLKNQKPNFVEFTSNNHFNMIVYLNRWKFLITF